MNTDSVALRIALVGDYERLAAQLMDWSCLGTEVEVVYFTKDFVSHQDAIAALQTFDVIAMMRERLPMPRQLIDNLPRLKLVVFTGNMNQMIDLQAAALRDLPICYAPALPGGAPSTPELTWGLLLACTRNIAKADAALRRGEWQVPPGEALAGKTLGLLGFGRVGKAVARYANAFDMRVLAWSRSLTIEHAAQHGVTAVDLNTLLSSSDVISVHLGLNDQTRDLLNADAFARMKPGAVLINTARGPIVNEAVLIEALHSGQLSAAGLDVFDREPLAMDHPLLQAPHTVLTPHIGYVTRESLRNLYGGLLEVLLTWQHGKIINRYQR